MFFAGKVVFYWGCLEAVAHKGVKYSNY